MRSLVNGSSLYDIDGEMFLSVSADGAVLIIHQGHVPVIVPYEKAGAGAPEDGAGGKAGRKHVSKFSGVSPNAMEMARPVLVEMEADGRLRSACDLLRHGGSGAEFVEEDLEEVRRRAGRGMEVVRGGWRLWRARAS